jgi:hypothetical protein
MSTGFAHKALSTGQPTPLCFRRGGKQFQIQSARNSVPPRATDASRRASPPETGGEFAASSDFMCKRHVDLKKAMN